MSNPTVLVSCNVISIDEEYTRECRENLAKLF